MQTFDQNPDTSFIIEGRFVVKEHLIDVDLSLKTANGYCLIFLPEVFKNSNAALRIPREIENSMDVSRRCRSDEHARCRRFL